MPSPAVGRPLFVSSAATPESAPTMVTFAGRKTTWLFDPTVSTHSPSGSTSLRFVLVSWPSTVYAKRSVMPPWSTLSRSIPCRLSATALLSSPSCRRSRGVPVTETGSLYSTSTRILSPRTKVSRTPSLSAS